jgi:hypothetical protein
MIIPPIPTNQPVFENKSILKTEFRRGRIPLKKDITGRKIKTVSIDHTIPTSKGGKSNLYNYSLMDRASNMERSNKPIKKSIDLESLIEYILVMMDVETDSFNGVNYLKGWLRTLKRALKENK